MGRRSKYAMRTRVHTLAHTHSEQQVIINTWTGPGLLSGAAVCRVSKIKANHSTTGYGRCGRLRWLRVRPPWVKREKHPNPNSFEFGRETN